MVLITLLAILPLGSTNAMAEPVELHIAGTNYMQVHLTGERQIQCTSKYHNVDLKAPFVSAFMLNSSQFNLLAPGAKVKPGDTWTADAFAVRFSDSLHRSKKYQPANAADKAALSRWLGSSLREKQDVYKRQAKPCVFRFHANSLGGFLILTAAPENGRESLLSAVLLAG